MRYVLSVIALAAVLLLPLSRSDRAGDLADLAPGAGDAAAPLLLLDSTTAPIEGPDLVDRLRDPEIRADLLQRHGLWLGALGGLVLGAVVARRRRPAPAPEVPPSEPDAPPVVVAEPPRPAANALAQALAAIDLIEVEARTSLRHLDATVADLAIAITASPFGSREPAARAADAGAALASLVVETAALRARHAAEGERWSTTRGDAVAAMARIQDVVAAAERMDAAFQHMIAAVEGIATLPRLFDDLEMRAGLGWPESGGQGAPAIAKARQGALLRIDGLGRAFEALTSGVVGIEERLVALDEAGVALTAGTAAAAADDGVLSTCEQRLERLAALLGDLPALLAPADSAAADLADKAQGAGAMIGQALGRLETILGNFVRAEERRRHHRMSCRMPARILLDGAWHDCTVTNLSLGGAAIDRRIDCRPGTEGQLSIAGWDTLVPLVVTGTSAAGTHLCFQINQTLAKSLIGYLETVQAA